jgi:hypothetical protein
MIRGFTNSRSAICLTNNTLASTSPTATAMMRSANTVIEQTTAMIVTSARGACVTCLRLTPRQRQCQRQRDDGSDDPAGEITAKMGKRQTVNYGHEQPLPDTTLRTAVANLRQGVYQMKASHSVRGRGMEMIGQNSESGLCKINPPTIARRDNVLSVCVEIPSRSSTRLSLKPLKSSETCSLKPRHSACWKTLRRSGTTEKQNRWVSHVLPADT